MAARHGIGRRSRRRYVTTSTFSSSHPDSMTARHYFFVGRPRRRFCALEIGLDDGSFGHCVFTFAFASP